MTINVDRSKPLLLPSDLRDLVRAIEAGDDNDEDDSLEWKSVIDLADNVSIADKIARNILGFANRPVDTSSKKFAGYSYVAVGVEPGNLCGIQTIDQAVLTPKIRSYVGGEISMSAEYIEVDGKERTDRCCVSPQARGLNSHPSQTI